MELTAHPTTFKAISNFTLNQFQFQCRCSLSLLRHCHYGFRHNRNSKPFLHITMCTEDKLPLSNGYSGGIDIGEEAKSDLVEVIAIGGRKDAVIDFCLNSPFQLSSLRFWNIIVKDSQEAQLQQRSTKQEPSPGIVKAPLFMKSCSKTIVLVAGAGYGSDHTVAFDIFETVRSTNGLTIAIVLKPFSFEGLRRKDEVKALMGKLKENTNLLIEIDIDALLKKDLLTLDEAMKIANDAVLLAIMAISVLKSEMHRKYIDRLHNSMKETCNSEIIKILECYKEARIGFGAAYNIKTSILQSIFDCPFLGVSLKDPNSAVICIIACSEPINDSDIAVFLRIFRQTTEYTRDIIISTVLEPDVEPNLLITTVLTLSSSTVQQPSQSGGILSKLALHFPLVFGFWGKHSQQQTVSGKEDASSHETMRSYNVDKGENRIAPSIIDDRFDKHCAELEPNTSNNGSKLSASRDSEKNEDLFDTSNCPIPYESVNEEGDSAFPREQLGNWNLGPGFEVAKEWAQEREADDTPMVDNLSIFHLPVGVRPSEESKDCLEISFMSKKHEPEAGVEAVMEFTSSFLKAKHGNSNKPKKHGVLSVRAASMLEAERDLSTKWSPVVEIQYRGGRYKGRCQGGLPEGKGRLVVGDGNIYDGLWHSGKRSGPGTFYFKNGDMFQGSWRDDVMHGKGWFYFHTGDRWLGMAMYLRLGRCASLNSLFHNSPLSTTVRCCSSSSPSSSGKSKPDKKKLGDRLSAVIDAANDRKLPPELRGQRNNVRSETDLINVVEQRIWHSMEEGQFENLPGKGKPLKLDTNPHADPAEDTLYRILSKNGCAPEWVELNKEIRFRISEWRMSLKKASANKCSEDQSMWVGSSQALKSQLKEINDKVFRYNLIVPFGRQMNGLKWEKELGNLDE